MQPQMEFYFDFVSPFSYLALQRLPEIAKRFGYEVDYRPVDLKRIKQLAGNTGPATREIPMKLRYARIDQQRWGSRYGVPIATPAFYDSSRLNCGFFFAADRGRQREYLMLAFRKVWGEGGHMLDEALLAGVARHLGWDEQAFIDYTLSQDGDRRYALSTECAHKRQVFGVPTILIGDDMWWGNDRLDFLEEHLLAEASLAKSASAG
jgi:2-hydroxychromene-2-carboxylate isomerase